VWDTAVDPGTAQAILARCVALEPDLADARVLSHAVGLRPGRPEPRLETERRDGGVVVHNYGHGGGGVTLSWGCAEEVVRHVAAAVR
jgi:D-amino-acid oxidase